MKMLQWAWISADSEPELFPSYRAAIDAMGKRIGEEMDAEADILIRAHGLGIRLAIVEVTLVVRAVFETK